MDFLRKKEIAEDIKEIKEAVESKPEPLPIYPSKFEFPKIETTTPERPKFAPLFVKVDRYKEVIELIEGLKMNLNDLNRLLDVRKEMKEVNDRIDEILIRNLNIIEGVVKNLDNELVRPSSIDRPEIYASTRLEHRDNLGKPVEQLHDELNRLRQKLQKM